MFVRVDFDQPITELVNEFLTEEFVPVSSKLPPIEIAESENDSMVLAEVPGMSKDDISISVENGWLTLKGERKPSDPADIRKVLHREIEHQPFSRTIKLPHSVNVGAISAQLENGILKITLPKAEEVRQRAIQIK